MVFWKKKKEEPPTPGPVARWLAGKIENIKEWWVKVMVKLTAKLSINQQRVGFAMLGLLCCSYCTFLVMQGFTVKSHKKTIPVNSISRLVSPKVTTSNDEYDKQEFSRIENLFYVMDSLKNDPEGKKQYDSIATYRPGLLDTLKKLEDYYKTE